MARGSEEQSVSVSGSWLGYLRQHALLLPDLGSDVLFKIVTDSTWVDLAICSRHPFHRYFLFSHRDREMFEFRVNDFLEPSCPL